MNGDARSTWPNAELHKEIAELRSQLAIAKAELENIKFLTEQAEICHQAELAEARNSTPSWIQDHTIEISRLKAELAEALKDIERLMHNDVESEKLCRDLVLKLAKTQGQSDDLRTQLAEAQRENAGCWCKLTGKKILKERDELRTQLTESRSKHLHDVLAEQILNQELRAAMSAEATEQAAPSTPQETHTPGA